MQHSKYTAWTRNYNNNFEDRTVANGRDVGGHISGDLARNDGWQHYRWWISKVPAPSQRRSGIDPSVYTWKGYRMWTEQIKRNWQNN